LAWTKLAPKDVIAIGKGKEFTVNGVRIAVFNVNGKFYATEALCRHQDGSLAYGKLEGEIIECPLHFWHYNVTSGELLDYLTGVKLNKYPVEVKGNDLYIDV